MSAASFVTTGLIKWVVLTVSAVGSAVIVLLVFSERAEGGPPSSAAFLAGHTVVFADSGNSLDDLHSTRAQCPPGKGVIAGGYSLSNSGIDDFVVLANHPGPQFMVQPEPGPPQVTHDGWDVQIRRLDEFTIPWGVLAYAVCVDTE